MDFAQVRLYRDGAVSDVELLKRATGPSKNGRAKLQAVLGLKGSPEGNQYLLVLLCVFPFVVYFFAEGNQSTLFFSVFLCLFFFWRGVVGVSFFCNWQGLLYRYLFRFLVGYAEMSCRFFFWGGEFK